MFKSIHLLIWVFIGFCHAIPHLSQNANSRISQCGGTIDADSDSLGYPDVGQPLQKGEVCVWTIHLETTKNFKFNFTSLNVNSNYGDCRDGGVRIYSLTNLVPADRLESYTFCDEKPSEDSFYLGENVAVVVLYVGSSNTNPGSGFNLSWEGSAFDPMKTKHVSSFSSASNGVIRYPVIGHYESNLVATWLIKSISLQQTTKSDLNLESLSLESCENSDTCTCDALILYEISSLGLVNETRRFCGEVTGAFLHGLESRFIVAFFTDFNTQSGGGSGFEVVYYQTEESTTDWYETSDPGYETTTTDWYDTTTEDWLEPTTDNWYTTGYPEETTTNEAVVISRKCGEVLEGRTGAIEYKVSQYFENNERCVWTIRIPDTPRIKFVLTKSGTTESADGVIVSTFKRLKNGTISIVNSRFPTVQLPATIELEGNVATVVFYSDYSSQGTGFILTFEAVGYSTPIYSSASKDLVLSTSPSYFNSIIHPAAGTYANNEFSTVLFTPENHIMDVEMSISYVKYELEGSCLDVLDEFVFTPGTGWLHYFRICGSLNNRTDLFYDVVMTIFSTDGADTFRGFGFQYHHNQGTAETTTPTDSPTTEGWWTTT